MIIDKSVHFINERENNREKAMHENDKARRRSMLPVSRRRFVQGLAAGGAVAALRLARRRGLRRDWPAADTRDAYG